MQRIDLAVFSNDENRFNLTEIDISDLFRDARTLKAMPKF